MKHTFFRLTLAFFLIAPAIAQERPLVSADWLKQHINDADLVILHVAFNRREFTQGHIPGSQFVWWDWIIPSNPDNSSELPSPREAQDLLRRVGVSKTSTIVVVFGRQNLTSGTRPLWTLQYFGLGDRSYLLDGGIEAWKTAGGDVTTETTKPRMGDVTVTEHPELFADAAYVKANLSNPGVTIVDARSKVYYDGRPTGAPKTGHIKGSVSIPYSSVVDSLTQFKSKEELQKMFDDAGVKRGTIVVTYCHVGQQATATLLAARMLGYTVRLYDGSFEDWGYRDDSYPVETPEVKE